jgi:hypothetical protein
VKIAVRFFIRIVGSVQNLFKVVLRILGSRIWEGLPTKSCSLSQYRSNQYLFTFFRWVFYELWIFLSQLGCCFRSEAESLPTVLEWLNEEIWLSLEYKSCSLFSVHGCRLFIRYHHHCEMKVIMMLSSSIAAVLFCSVVCSCGSSGGSVGSLCLLIVSCVWLFWCWELFMVRWCSFGPCLTLWLDNWRR